MNSRTTFKAVKFYSQLTYLAKHFIYVTPPSEIPKTFSEIIGMESEKAELCDAIRYLKNLKLNQADPIHAPHSRYLLAGAPGSGKTLLVSSIAKEANVPLIKVDMSAFVSFPNEALKLVNQLFKVIKVFKKGCVIHIQNFNAMESLPAEILTLFNNSLTQKIAKCTNAIVIMSTIGEQIKLPIMYFSPNVFSSNKVISIQPPSLATRTALLTEYFKKYDVHLAEDVTAERIARSTLGMYPKDIEFIVRETNLYAERNNVSVLSLKEFNDVMLNMVDSQTHTKMTEKERLSVAYHEAGHVVAAYYSNPEFILGRVEITPRSSSLGLTQGEIGDEKYSMFKSDYENSIIYSFGGMAAERLIYGENSSGVSADLAYCSTVALAMYNNFGMSMAVGPIVIDDTYGFCSIDINNSTEVLVKRYLEGLYNKTFDIVSTHRAQLDALAHALVKHEVLMGEEIKKILDEIDFPET